MSLLQLADITLHSGRPSFFKIECDALTDEDWRAAAGMLARVLPPFALVEGVPRGGLPLARHLTPFAIPDAPGYDRRRLIVDDVWTTGGSMEVHRAGRDAIGAVLFARGPVAPWVTPLFRLHEGLWAA